MISDHIVIQSNGGVKATGKCPVLIDEEKKTDGHICLPVIIYPNIILRHYDI